MNEHLSDQPFDVRVFVEVDKATLAIAAVLYDVADGEELASFNRLVGEADESDFPAVITELKKFCRHYPVWTFDKSQEILEQNCAYFSIAFPFRVPFIRVKSLLRSWKVNPRKYSGSTLYKAAGVKMNDETPGVLFTARSVAAAVSYFENQLL